MQPRPSAGEEQQAGTLSRLTPFLSVLSCAAIGAVCARLGGFEDFASAPMLLVWILGSVFTRRSPGAYALECSAGLAVATAIILWASPAPGYPGWYLTIMLTAIGMLASGLTMHDHFAREELAARQRLELANRRLEEEQDALARWNRELEGRVAEQVDEIVRRAREIEALNAQLRDRVVDRSRELASALAALGHEPRPIPAGAVLRGRVRVLAPIAAGGMGDVYLAEDLAGGERVVVKTLRARRFADRAHLRRFVAEAAAAAAVGHPGIVRMQSVDVTEDGQLFQIMEHVEGETLAQQLERLGPIEPHRLARLGSALASALAAAHEAGVVHRDVKPANVMLTRVAPGVRVLDFGVSKLRHVPARARNLELTQPNQVMGTPAYMSPEQCRCAGEVTAAADVYSLGVLLFEAVEGRLPFDEREVRSVFDAHASTPPPPLSPSVPTAVAEVVLDCLAKDPARRPTAAQVALRLAHIADEASVPPAEVVVARAA